MCIIHSNTTYTKLDNIFLIFMKPREWLLPAGYPQHRENRENGQKRILCQGKHREFGNFAKTGNLVCSSYKFPDCKSKRYLEICSENLPKNLDAC